MHCEHLEGNLEAQSRNGLRDLRRRAWQHQHAGDYGAALTLMLQAVSLPAQDIISCQVLKELAELYLAMLKLDDAEAVCNRMLQEAPRCHSEDQ